MPASHEARAVHQQHVACFHRIKYYNNSLFHNVQSNFIAQAGAPAGSTTGGTSVYG